MAGVLWFFDSESQAYKVRSGFKFPAIHTSAGKPKDSPDPIVLLVNAQKTIEEGERFLDSLRQFGLR